MTWNTVTLVWMLLSAVGTIAITIGIAVWVLKHYNQDIQERESVQQLSPQDQQSPQDTASDTPKHT
jgi:hypothetical protein